ncbi:uncharacterized protein LOC117107192 [Anneissia japonica]|uniref:uncharacterized protein LOC117107192 n=1 Tax=Anneissia japonica TaxID=1529436 RepID=UPI001425B6D5|nr:uncharacterized protein LOC117107192 [Anneissia japonica]XP_033104692.1 uncharacterized protein LOC117107192 [Anneissia japonica]
MEEEFPDSMYLPRGLIVKGSGTNKKKLGIYSNITIKAGVKYGPFKGEKKNISEVLDDSFAWMIRNFSGRPQFFVDAANIESANWMRFVKCSPTVFQHNLVIIQRRKKIFFKVTKDINVGDELLIGFQLSRDGCDGLTEHDVINNELWISKKDIGPTPFIDVNEDKLSSVVNRDNHFKDVNIDTERNVFDEMSSATEQVIPGTGIRVTWPSGTTQIGEPLSKMFKSYVRLLPLDIPEKTILEYQQKVGACGQVCPQEHNHVIDNDAKIPNTITSESCFYGGNKDLFIRNYSVVYETGESLHAKQDNCHSNVLDHDILKEIGDGVPYTERVLKISEHDLNKCAKSYTESLKSNSSYQKGAAEGVCNTESNVIFSTDMNRGIVNMNDYNIEKSQGFLNESNKNEKEARFSSTNGTGNTKINQLNKDRSISTDDSYFPYREISDQSDINNEELMEVMDPIENRPILKKTVKRHETDESSSVQEPNAADRSRINVAKKCELEPRIVELHENNSNEVGLAIKRARTGDIASNKYEQEVNQVEVTENIDRLILEGEVKTTGSSKDIEEEKTDNTLRKNKRVSFENIFANFPGIQNGLEVVIQKHNPIESNEDLQLSDASDLEPPSNEPQNLKRLQNSDANELRKYLKQENSRPKDTLAAVKLPFPGSERSIHPGSDRRMPIPTFNKNNERKKFKCWACNIDFTSYDAYFDHVMVDCKKRTHRQTETRLESSKPSLNQQTENLQTNLTVNKTDLGYNTPLTGSSCSRVAPEMDPDSMQFSGTLRQLAFLAKLTRDRVDIMQNSRPILPPSRCIADPSTLLNFQPRSPTINSLNLSLGNKYPVFSKERNTFGGALDYSDINQKNESPLTNNTRKRNYQGGLKLLPRGLQLKAGICQPAPFIQHNISPTISENNHTVTDVTDARGGPRQCISPSSPVGQQSTSFRHVYSASYNTGHQFMANTTKSHNSSQIKVRCHQEQWLPNQGRPTLYRACNEQPILKLLPPKRMPFLMRHVSVNQPMPCSLDPERWKKHSRGYKSVLKTTK